MILASPPQKKRSLLYRYSFPVIVILLVAFELFTISKANWKGDFWEHAAVVKALSENLLHPSNPIIKGDMPHAFFSPYSLLVASFARIVHLDSVTALGYAAFANLIIFLFGFYAFCVALFGERARPVAALSLLFILFFWGKAPFNWSGFYHFKVLSYVLPYPSTFAMGLSLFTLSLVVKEQPSAWYTRKTIWVILLNTIVVLTHPHTGMFLFIALATLNFCFGEYDAKYALLKSALQIIPAILLALVWPYFTIADFLFGNNHDFQESSKGLFTGRLRINWPVLLVFPGLLVIKRDKAIHFLLLTIVIMSGLYLVGFFSKQYVAGRLVSDIVMFAHFLLAYMAVICLSQKLTRNSILYLSLLAAGICTSLYLNGKAFIDTINPKRFNTPQKYGFLRNTVSTDDVILADETSDEFIPAFSGKVITAVKPIYWIPDIEERKRNVHSFFNTNTSDSFRMIIIQKYHPDYILLDHENSKLSAATILWLQELGNTVYNQNLLELIRIKK